MSCTWTCSFPTLYLKSKTRQKTVLIHHMLLDACREPWQSSLGLHLWHLHDVSVSVCVPTAPLLIQLPTYDPDRQQKMVHGLEPLPPHRRPWRSFWLSALDGLSSSYCSLLGSETVMRDQSVSFHMPSK